MGDLTGVCILGAMLCIACFFVSHGHWPLAIDIDHHWQAAVYLQ